MQSLRSERTDIQMMKDRQMDMQRLSSGRTDMQVMNGKKDRYAEVEN